MKVVKYILLPLFTRKELECFYYQIADWSELDVKRTDKKFA